MAEDRNPGPETTDRVGPGPHAHLDQTLWRRFAEATSDVEFASAWLGLQARMISGVTAGVVVLTDEATGTLQPAAVWPPDFHDAERFRDVLDRAVRERKGVVRRNDADRPLASPEDLRFLLAYPVWLGDRLQGVAAIQINPRPQIQLQAAMRALQWGVAWIQNRALRSGADPERSARERLALALELTAAAVEEPGARAAATAFVTQLATRLGCDRVSVGFVRGDRVEVLGLSHSAQFAKQMNLFRSIGMAMEESVDQQAILVWPDTDAHDAHAVSHAHEQLARGHGARAVCTVPFLDRDGEAFGALTLERTADEPFDAETVQLCDTVAALVGPVLQDKRSNDRPLPIKIRDSLWTQVLRLIGPGHAVRKLVVGVLLILAVFFAVAHGTYRVTAESTLEGAVQRAVVAPYRAFLSEVSARAGDVVAEGDLLALLDDRDLRLEYARWSSERDQYAVERQKAMAEGDRASRNVLDKKIRQAEAQLALLDEQIARSRIVAPFDGVVVQGDLSQSLGSPVELGDVLFEIAPLDAYRLKLEVDERDIADVAVGQEGGLVLTGLPRERFRFAVSRITPVTVAEEGRSYFVVEASLRDASERLRPGMEGYAKIEIDRRRLIRIWTRRMIDWIRLKAWTWMP